MSLPPAFFDADAPAPARKAARAPLTAAEQAAWVAAWIEAGRAAGTYADRVETVCHVCRQWCDGHYYRSLTGVEHCKACYLKAYPPKAANPLGQLGPSSLVLITPAAPGRGRV